MADVTGVRWTPETGDTVVFAEARGFHTDGYGDYVFTDQEGKTVATRKRAKTDNVECVYSSGE